MTLIASPPLTWLPVCPIADLVPGRGVAALVAGNAVAVFLLDDGSVRAIDDRDPFSGASVLSRGLVGSTGAGDGPVRYVASPLRKQRFDLATGRCLDGDAAVGVWVTRVSDGLVEVGHEDSRGGNGPETSP